MRKALMLSAIMATVATAAHAKRATYTFGSLSGNTYCDGVALPSLNAPYVTATHLYAACAAGVDSQMGGFLATIKGIGRGYVLAQSCTPGSLIGTPYIEVAFALSPRTLEWVLGYESTYYGIPFELVDRGPLIPGYDGHATQSGRSADSSVHATLVKTGLIRK